MQLSILDLEKLLVEISPDAPCGANLEYDAAFIALEEEMKGTPEVQIGDKILRKAQPPNWPKIQKTALKLFERTYDMRVAIVLLTALLNNNGLHGLREGLALLEDLMVRYWDSIHPRLDPEDGNDPTQRISILTALCDRDTIIPALMETKLCASKAMGRFSLRDVHIATGKLNIVSGERESASNMATIEAAFADSDTVFLKELREAAGESSQSLDNMESFLREKAAVQPPDDNSEQYRSVSFSVTQNLLHEIDRLLAQQMEGESGAKNKKKDTLKLKKQSVDKKTRLAQPAASRTDNAMETINNREDIIRILDRICIYYETNEPASPVPLLLKRAMRLVSKDFFEIIQDLAPDSVSQVQLISGAAEDKP